MATYYSAFFSSGLLASTNDDPFVRSQSPEPSTPKSAAIDLTDDSTPTPPSTSLTSSTLPSISEANASLAPALRRRRSSMTLGASPVSSMKIRSNAASNAQKNHSILSSSPSQGSLRSRARAGSVHESVFSRISVAANNEATEKNSLVGRLRSGSIGTALRPRRQLRKAVPALPPPTAPLPALPSIPSCSPTLSLTIPNASSSLPIQTPTTPRQLFMHRSHTTTDQYFIPIDTPSLSRSASLRSGAEDYFMSVSPTNTANAGLPEGSTSAAGAYDYPSPIETPGEKNIAGYFFSPQDVQMPAN